jgi:hypothetical protein
VGVRACVGVCLHVSVSESVCVRVPLRMFILVLFVCMRVRVSEHAYLRERTCACAFVHFHRIASSRARVCVSACLRLCLRRGAVRHTRGTAGTGGINSSPRDARAAACVFAFCAIGRSPASAAGRRAISLRGGDLRYE